MLPPALQAIAAIINATHDAAPAIAQHLVEQPIVFGPSAITPQADILELASKCAAENFRCLLVPAFFCVKHQIASLFINNLLGHTTNPQLIWRAQTALHEAIFNAVLHGNLGMKSTDKSDDLSLIDSLQLLETTAATSPNGQKYVLIAGKNTTTDLQLIIADEGQGFDYQRVIAAQASGQDAVYKKRLPSGRGLQFILKLADKLEFTLGGRCATLYFNH